MRLSIFHAKSSLKFLGKIIFCIFRSFADFRDRKNYFSVNFMAEYCLELNSNAFKFLNFVNRPTRSQDTISIQWQIAKICIKKEKIFVSQLQ